MIGPIEIKEPVLLDGRAIGRRGIQGELNTNIRCGETLSWQNGNDE
jgi:hypothetical protein